MIIRPKFRRNKIALRVPIINFISNNFSSGYDAIWKEFTDCRDAAGEGCTADYNIKMTDCSAAFNEDRCAKYHQCIYGMTMDMDCK